MLCSDFSSLQPVSNSMPLGWINNGVRAVWLCVCGRYICEMYGARATGVLYSITKLNPIHNWFWRCTLNTAEWHSHTVYPIFRSSILNWSADSTSAHSDFGNTAAWINERGPDFSSRHRAKHIFCCVKTMLDYFINTFIKLCGAFQSNRFYGNFLALLLFVPCTVTRFGMSTGAFCMDCASRQFLLFRFWCCYLFYDSSLTGRSFPAQNESGRRRHRRSLSGQSSLTGMALRSTHTVLGHYERAIFLSPHCSPWFQTVHQ